MARASSVGENGSLAGLSGTGSTNLIPDGALNVGDPGTTGASENANAGSYARQANTWASPSGGSMATSASQTYATLGTIAVTAVSEWSSATYAGGNYAIGAMLGSSVTAASITVASGAKSYSSS